MAHVRAIISSPCLNGMKKNIFPVFLTFCLLLPPSILFAAGCPEISAPLRVELYRKYPQYELALIQTFPEREQKKILRTTGEGCTYIVAQDDSTYAILLKNKISAEYLLVQAGPHQEGGDESWPVRQLDVFVNDIPLIQTVQAGFYSDMLSKKNFTITRHSQAFSVILLQSGQHFIYKSTGSHGLEKFRIE